MIIHHPSSSVIKKSTASNNLSDRGSGVRRRKVYPSHIFIRTAHPIKLLIYCGGSSNSDPSSLSNGTRWHILQCVRTTPLLPTSTTYPIPTSSKMFSFFVENFKLSICFGYSHATRRNKSRRLVVSRSQADDSVPILYFFLQKTWSWQASLQCARTTPLLLLLLLLLLVVLLLTTTTTTTTTYYYYH